MLEIPEARTVARQLRETVLGKTIERAAAASSPHGFAWYFGDPGGYATVMSKKNAGAPCPACGDLIGQSVVHVTVFLRTQNQSQP